MEEIKLQKLKLPQINPRITWKEGLPFIWDDIRKKNVFLTEEEWVRQHFIQLMIKNLSYPKSLIKVESGTKYFKSRKRTDIELMDRNGKIFLLIECKAPGIKINNSVLNQISIYNHSVNAKYVSVTNGNKHYIWQYDPINSAYLTLNTFPEFPLD